MKRLILFTFLLFFWCFSGNSQSVVNLKKTLVLQMPKIDGEHSGKNGASVVWHPGQKKYYAAFAGRSSYPLGVFSANGDRLSNDDMKTLIDVRGLWYNPNKKEVWGNGYYLSGWFSYKLSSTGLVIGIESETEDETSQAEDNAVGVYNADANVVLFLSYDAKVHVYTHKGSFKETIAIHWGRTSSMKTDIETYPDLLQDSYSYHSLAYTGTKGQELGFLNVLKKQVELYEIKTGFLTKILKLPDSVKLEEKFNFSYANGIYWLFDIQSRAWVGYN